MNLKIKQVIENILGDKLNNSEPRSNYKDNGSFAPANLALCKYWGKRCDVLNLPFNSSLSIGLGINGCVTKVDVIGVPHDIIIRNGIMISRDSFFYKRISAYLDLFRGKKKWNFLIETKINIPVSAGLASSSCGFAALINSLNDFFMWELGPNELSILARIGSGSACRSIWPGFVEWPKGTREDGMDCHGVPLNETWDDLEVGILIVDENEKATNSREGMATTVATSEFYKLWPSKAENDLEKLKSAIKDKDFELLGKTAESNAFSMAACMLDSKPALIYWHPKTIEAIEKIRKLRADGLSVYITFDAGPNIFVLFMRKDLETIIEKIPDIIIA